MGRGCARPTASDTSVDARLDALQKDVDLAHERINQTQDELDRAARAHSGAIQEEQRWRQLEDEKLRGMLETTETGGLSLSGVGAVWLFIGVAFSTVAPGLSKLLS